MYKYKLAFNDLNFQYKELKDEISKRINIVLNHGQYIMGPEVYELEEKLANFLKIKYCISTSSGTDSILIAMMALNVGPGDEVITPTFSYCATAEIIGLLGARAVFVDIDPLTFNIDANKIENLITKRTKAIVPVSLFGQIPDMDRINEIASKYAIPVIEDAAQSFGARYKNKLSCSLTTIGVTSFFPSKPLGGYGDGGALFTNDDNLAEIMREIRTHGQKKKYHHVRIGINGRLDTIQAAILLAKFERFPWELSQREIIGRNYTQKIKDSCSKYITPYVKDINNSIYSQYTIQVDNREKIVEKLNKSGIPTAIYYPLPLHLQIAFKDFGYKAGDFPFSEIAAGKVLSLPIGPDLSESQQNLVIDSLVND